MGMIDKIKKIDATKVALGASLAQNLVSAAEIARLRDENQRLANVNQSVIESEGESEIEGNYAQLLESLDNFTAKLNKRNLGIINNCAQTVEYISLLLKQNPDLAVSEWLWGKESINLDAFMKRKPGYIPDEPDKAYFDSLKGYKKLNGKMTNLDLCKRITSLLQANAEANNSKELLKGKSFSLDDIRFNNDISSIWLALTKPPRSGCLAIGSIFMIGACTFFLIAAIYELLLGSSNFPTGQYIIIIWSFIVGVISSIPLFCIQSKRNSFKEKRDAFLKEFVQIWNNEITDANVLINQYESKRENNKKILEDTIGDYSDRIIGINPRLSELKTGYNNKGLPCLIEIVNNIEYLSKPFAQNNSLMTKDFLIQKMHKQTGVPLAEARTNILDIIIDSICPNH